MPGKLEQLGLFKAIGATVSHRLSRPPYPDGQQFSESTLNVREVASFSLDLADSVDQVLKEDSFPLIVGGDCSVLVGCGAGLKKHGRHGLVYLDAHLDYKHPGNVDRGAVGGMSLAIVTGDGANSLINLWNQGPYFDHKDIFAIGYRFPDPRWEWMLTEFHSKGMSGMDAETSKRIGVVETVEEVFRHMNHQRITDFWIHLDTDVLDRSLMPAVDCPEPDGLSFNELGGILRGLLQGGNVAGMNISILDPDLDSSGKVTKAFSDMLIQVFRSSGVRVDH